VAWVCKLLETILYKNFVRDSNLDAVVVPRKETQQVERNTADKLVITEGWDNLVREKMNERLERRKIEGTIRRRRHVVE